MKMEVNDIVEDNIKLVHFIIKKHFPHFIGTAHYDDVVQEGCIGLLKAIDRYDESLGFEFSTYAYTVIKGNIYKNTKDLLTPTKVPRGSLFVYKDYLKLAEEGLTLEEAAKKLGIRKCTLEGIINVHSYSSLEYVVCEGNDGSTVKLIDVLSDEVEEDYSKELRTCNRLIRLLPEDLRDKFVLYINGETQINTAKRFNTSQVTISRRLTKVREDYLPLFKKYIEGYISYGSLLIKIYELNKGINEYIRCYIDYYLELCSRGSIECTSIDYKGIKNILDSKLPATMELINLIKIIDSHCSRDGVEELVDDMVGIYKIGHLDRIAEFQYIDPTCLLF